VRSPFGRGDLPGLRGVSSWLFAAVAILAVRPLPAEAAYRLEPLKEAAPEEVAGELREQLSGEGLRMAGPKGPYLDFWWRKTLPTVAPKGDQGIDFGQIEEGEFFGVARVHQQVKDFKGKNFPPGLYTLRRGVQPQDGDHLGVSDTRDFLLLSPAKIDVKLASMPTDELVKLSVKASGTKHPSVLYLMKMFEPPGKLPRLVEDSEKSHWILDCELPAAGATKERIRFGLVVVGQSSH
jgi:hypothetical protein